MERCGIGYIFNLLVQLTGAVWRETKTCPAGTAIPVHRRLQWHLSYKWIFIILRFAYYRGSIAYVVEFICRLCNSITDIVNCCSNTNVWEFLSVSTYTINSAWFVHLLELWQMAADTCTWYLLSGEHVISSRQIMCYIQTNTILQTIII